MPSRITDFYCWILLITAASCVSLNQGQEVNDTIRLTNGGNNYGRLEVSFRGVWGTVCDVGWDDVDATVACRQLGFFKGKAHHGAFFGEGNGTIGLSNVACLGGESNLLACSTPHGWDNNTCGHDEDAGVNCTGIASDVCDISLTIHYIKSHPVYCDKFILCISNNGIVQNCPTGMFYKDKEKQCVDHGLETADCSCILSDNCRMTINESSNSTAATSVPSTTSNTYIASTENMGSSNTASHGIATSGPDFTISDTSTAGRTYLVKTYPTRGTLPTIVPTVHQYSMIRVRFVITSVLYTAKLNKDSSPEYKETEAELLKMFDDTMRVIHGYRNARLDDLSIANENGISCILLIQCDADRVQNVIFDIEAKLSTGVMGAEWTVDVSTIHLAVSYYDEVRLFTTLSLISIPFTRQLNDTASTELTKLVVVSLNMTLEHVAGYQGANIVHVYISPRSITKVDAIIRTTGSVRTMRQELSIAVENRRIGNFTTDNASIPITALSSTGVPVTFLGTIRTGLLYEKKDVRVMCDLYSAIPVVINWLLDGGYITNGLSQRIRIQTEEHNGKWTSTMNFKPLRLDDSANKLTCRASYNNGINVSSIVTEFAILSLPITSIHPKALTVRHVGPVNITCTSLPIVTGHVDSRTAATIEWFIDDSVFFSDSGSNITRRVDGSEVLTLSIFKDTVVTCVGTNIVGSSRRSMTVTLLTNGLDSSQICQAEASQNIMWSLTAAGQNDIQQCTNGTGNAERRCLSNAEENAVWDEVDFSGCISQEMNIIKQQVDGLKDGKGETTLEVVSANLRSFTAPRHGRTLHEGDLHQASNALADITTLGIGTTTNKTEIQNVLEAASNLLFPENAPNWKKLHRKRPQDGSSNVMRTIGRYARQVSLILNLGEAMTVTTPNIVVQARKLEQDNIPSNLKFPSRNGNIPGWLETSSNEITIQKETLDRLYEGKNSSIGLSSIFYKTLEEILPQTQSNESSDDGQVVNSYVLSLSLEPSVDTQLDPPITISFEHLNLTFTNPDCSFWDFSLSTGSGSVGGWSTFGSSLETTTPNTTTCIFSHVTNFAILMSPSSTPDALNEVLSIISMIGLSISLAGLMITVIVHVIVWRYIKSDRAVILMNLCVALFIADVIFLGGVDKTSDDITCKLIASLLHYFFLVVFFFMLTEAVELYMQVVYVFATQSRLRIYFPIGWGVPLLIVAISLGATQTDGYNTGDYCWLSLSEGVLYAFVGPACLIILVNTVILVCVMRAMFGAESVRNKSEKEKIITGIRSLCVIMPVLGGTWILGVMSVNDNAVFLQFAFAILNSLQGLFIFIFHCAASKHVRDAFKAKYRKWKHRRSSRADLPSTRTTSESEQKRKSKRTSRPNSHSPNELNGSSPSINKNAGLHVQRIALDGMSPRSDAAARVDSNARSDINYGVPKDTGWDLVRTYYKTHT